MDLTAFTPDLKADMGFLMGNVEIGLMNIFSKMFFYFYFILNPCLLSFGAMPHDRQYVR